LGETNSTLGISIGVLAVVVALAGCGGGGDATQGPGGRSQRRAPTSTGRCSGHEPTFHMKQAGYTPMVSDGERLFLIGYHELIGLEPR
ncbi:MAG TPA: hypothetical protein VF125_06665, partial [Solirubrobacterales bacterium]